MRTIMIIAAWLLAAGAFAQQDISSVLNSTGLYARIANETYDHSVGEMVLVDTYQWAGTQLTQGFLQPYLMLAKPTEPGLAVANNFITPNGDGKNDRLVIPGIEKHPGNRIRIFDRAGREVFKQSPYANGWDGKLNGRLLAEDTYYYVFEPGPGYGKVRGFVTIIHDNER